MRIRKILIAILALAVAIAFSPLSELQAATFANPGSQPGSDNLTQTVKMKKKGYKKAGKKKRGKRGKRARSKAGKCGTYKYFSKKTRKCADARNK
ncbi:MAG: hypothetical protein E6G91_07100, partial [Alphaproteobacteria bacterium]|jgi:hypothetical protein